MKSNGLFTADLPVVTLALPPRGLEGNARAQVKKLRIAVDVRSFVSSGGVGEMVDAKEGISFLQVEADIEKTWRTVWRKLEVIHAGHPRKKVREEAGNAIATIRSSLIETKLLGDPASSNKWDREFFEEARNQHLKASRSIDRFQASLHLSRKRDLGQLT
jgi:hypothetical protein